MVLNRTVTWCLAANLEILSFIPMCTVKSQCVFQPNSACGMGNGKLIHSTLTSLCAGRHLAQQPTLPKSEATLQYRKDYYYYYMNKKVHKNKIESLSVLSQRYFGNIVLYEV